MSFRTYILSGALLVLASPLFASTYYGGVEDWKGLDYDYNDVVFSLSGNNIALHSAGQWHSGAAMGAGGTPFWDRSSLDGPNYNIGNCIYGGGSCGSAIAPNAQYLAGASGANSNVSFTATGDVSLTIMREATMGKNVIGWYAIKNPTVVNWLNPNLEMGHYVFHPGGAFGLVDVNQSPSADGTDYTFYSQSWLGTPDDLAHFAFFADPAMTMNPEPSVVGLFSIGLLGAGLIAFRRRQAASR